MGEAERALHGVCCSASLSGGREDETLGAKQKAVHKIPTFATMKLAPLAAALAGAAVTAVKADWTIISPSIGTICTGLDMTSATTGYAPLQLRLNAPGPSCVQLVLTIVPPSLPLIA
jgi:hypothetical protein